MNVTPGNVIAVGVAVGTVGWLGWELVGRAAWLVGRAQREIEDRLWMRDERRQERFLRTHDRCRYTAEEIRADIARSDMQRFEEREAQREAEAMGVLAEDAMQLERLRFFNLSDWVA